MKKTAALTVIIMIVMSLALSACGQANQTKPGKQAGKAGQTQSKTGTNGQTKQPAAATIDPKNIKGQVEVVVPAGDYMDFMKKQIKPYFEKEYPNATLKVTAEGGTDKFQARIAAGDFPDVYVGVFGYQPAKYAKLGKIIPLEGMPGASALTARIDPKYIVKDFGHLYSIPWNVTTQMMIYNKNLFKEAGLDPNKPPQTFDEFLTDAKKISALPKRKNGDKTYGTIFWNDALTWGGWYWTMLAQMYYNFNDGKYQLFNKYGTDIVFDNPDAHMTDLFQFLRNAQQYAPKTMKNNFFHRNIGMWLQYGYGWKTNLKQAKDKPMVIGKDVGIAPIPTVKAGQTHWSTLDGRSLMIFKTNKQRELNAWALVNFLMKDSYNLESDKMLGALPVLKKMETDPYFQLPENKPFVDQLQHSLMNEPFASLDDVSNVLEKELVKVQVEKSVSPKQGVQDAAKSARDILKKNSSQ